MVRDRALDEVRRALVALRVVRGGRPVVAGLERVAHGRAAARARAVAQAREAGRR